MRLDVVQPADIVSAAAGKPRIDGCLDAVRIVVRRSDREVFGDPDCGVIEVVAAIVAVIASGERQPRPELVLHFRRKIPVRIPFAPPAEHFVGPARGERVVFAEVPIRNRITFAVHLEVAQVAIRNVISVGVSPRAGDPVYRGRDRIVIIGDIHAGLPHIPA